MKEYLKEELFVGIIDNNGIKSHYIVEKDKGNVYRDIFTGRFYGGVNMSIKIGYGRFDVVKPIGSYLIDANPYASEERIKELLSELNSASISIYDNTKELVSGEGKYKYLIDSLYVGMIEEYTVKKHLALVSENAVLYKEIFDMNYYGAPRSSLKLGKGTLNRITKMSEYVTSTSGYISSDEIKALLSKLNKQYNRNIADIVLMNISNLYDFINRCGFVENENQRLLDELNEILNSYVKEIEEFSEDTESNSDSTSYIKAKYMQKLIDFDERLKDYINYINNFDNQVVELRRKINNKKN